MKKIIIPFLLLSACIVTIAAPVKSMLSAREEIKGGEPWYPTASDYIQDGLVANWDAIENFDYGVHIDYGKWRDLVGGLETYQNGEFTDNANIARYGAAGNFEISNDSRFAAIYNNFTIEVVLVDGDWTNASYTHSIQWLVRDTDNNIRTIFQGAGVYGNLSRVGDWRYFMNVPSNISVGMFREHPDGGYVRALGQTFDGFSNRAYREGRLVHEEQRVIDWEPQPGPMAYRLRMYNTGTIFRFHALRIYSRALSDAELWYNHQVDRLRFNLP